MFIYLFYKYTKFKKPNLRRCNFIMLLLYERIYVTEIFLKQNLEEKCITIKHEYPLKDQKIKFGYLIVNI